METWIDEKYNLEWEMDNPNDCMDWYSAIVYAKTLGNGWRVPKIEELDTWGDKNRPYPAIRKEIPFNISEDYWSSETHASHRECAWIMDFQSADDAYVISTRKTNRSNVRCVRDVA